MAQRATASGDDLEQALQRAVQDLVDADDVKVRLTLPADIEVRAVEVTLEADVSGADADDEAAPGADDADAAVDSEPVDSEPVDSELDDSEPDDDADEPSDEEPEDGPTLDDEADAAADFVEGLLDALDLPGQLKIRILDEEDMAEVEVVEVGSGALIGRRGSTLEAVQELLRSAMQREFQRRSRVKVDVEGYRARRLEKLLDKAEDAIDDVLGGDEAERLEPMDVFERKAVHRLVASYDGVSSRSQGREPGRRVIIERS